ncbi:acyl carrier protein [Granulicella pectinivorans]|jgi:acyl carrier protein|uniref:Acyl carrier protein n=1 Tax=Granulicella pectinivorans TaxID=474950 RepID=A0A1I6M5B4_9BACT|nr:acyl carrier protein [Granulicella pectinivorans]SFS10907.1 acyl carrier protein [Granulicella pectinivorans]
MDNLLQQVQEIFRDVFDQPNLVITRESNASTVEDWDSLAHINLVNAIQKEFKIKFALGELQELKNVGDMIDLMHVKLAAKK